MKILGATTDFGAASTMVPGLRRLKENGEEVVTAAWADTPASNSFLKAGFPPAYEETAHAIHTEKPDFVLVGITGGGTKGIDRIALDCAFRFRIPSAVLFETWPDRWLSTHSEEEIALYKKANRLFITDTIARQTLIDQGFNPLAIIVTGNPVNDEIVRIARSREAYRKEIRDQYRIPLDATLILFVTTNDLDIEANSSPEHPEWLGIKEEDVIMEYLEATREVSRKNSSIRGLIRQKPSHGTRRITELIQSICPSVGLDMRQYEMGIPTLLAADVVIGVATLAVQNAAVLGIPAVYYMPNLCKEDPMITNKLRITIPYYGRGELARLIRGIGDSPRRVTHELKREMQPITLPEDATGNVVKEILAFKR